MSEVSASFDFEKPAHLQAGNLITSLGRDAWKVATERAWNSQIDRRQSDYWWSVACIIRSRLHDRIA